MSETPEPKRNEVDQLSPSRSPSENQKNVVDPPKLSQLTPKKTSKY